MFKTIVTKFSCVSNFTCFSSPTLNQITPIKCCFTNNCNYLLLGNMMTRSTTLTTSSHSGLSRKPNNTIYFVKNTSNVSHFFINYFLLIFLLNLHSIFK